MNIFDIFWKLFQDAIIATAVGLGVQSCDRRQRRPISLEQAGQGSITSLKAIVPFETFFIEGILRFQLPCWFITRCFVHDSRVLSIGFSSPETTRFLGLVTYWDGIPAVATAFTSSGQNVPDIHNLVRCSQFPSSLLHYRFLPHPA